MDLNVSDITYTLLDEEGLSYLFFETAHGYFTISRSEDEKDVYLELDTQTNGEDFDQQCFDIVFLNRKIAFKMDLNNAKLVQYLKEKNKCFELYKEIVLLFNPVSQEKFSEMKKVIDQIFNERLTGKR